MRSPMASASMRPYYTRERAAERARRADRRRPQPASTIRTPRRPRAAAAQAARPSARSSASRRRRSRSVPVRGSRPRVRERADAARGGRRAAAPHVVAAPAALRSCTSAGGAPLWPARAKIEAQVAVASPAPVAALRPRGEGRPRSRAFQRTSARSSSGRASRRRPRRGCARGSREERAAEPAGRAAAAEPVAQPQLKLRAAPEPTCRLRRSGRACGRCDRTRWARCPTCPRVRISSPDSNKRARRSTRAPPASTARSRSRRPSPTADVLLSALIDGVFVGTPEGSCIARAVRARALPAVQPGELEGQLSDRALSSETHGRVDQFGRVALVCRPPGLSCAPCQKRPKPRAPRGLKPIHRANPKHLPRR